MTDATRDEEMENCKESKPTWSSLLVDIASKHAKEMVGGALALAGTVEGDIRAFVMRFIRELVLGIVFLFIGFGFAVFGLGMALVEALHLGPSAGSLVVGAVFAVIGSMLLVFSRR